jgi:Putative peptidoglycan binding domain
MRIFLVLICSLALAFATVAQGAKKEGKSKKKKSAKTEQVSKPGGKRPPVSRSRGPTKPAVTSNRTAASKPAKAKQRGTTANTRTREARPGAASKPTKAGRRATASRSAASRSAVAERSAVARGRTGKPFKTQRFNLATTTRPTKIQGVKFQQNRRIRGSDRWAGGDYWAFRNYRSEWRNRSWWRSHHSRFVFIFGGWYYWNAGYWFPAWGYDPYGYYAYDGPIYAYNDLSPDQVVANVQAALQQDGYYYGHVDGLLGPLTRDALANYQRDRGLYVTSAIDRPTLESLGMT